MAITIQNLRIQPFSQKNELKCVWGDTLTLTFAIPHVAGESYVCGIDNERVVYPPSRPVCAYTNVFTRDGDNVTFSLPLNTSKFRSYVSSIRKPMPVWLQVCRVGIDGKCETLVLDDILAIPSVLDATNTVCPGDPLKQLLEGKMDKPAAAGAEGQVLMMDADGHYAWADLPHIPEDPVQSDWNESDSSNLSYIRNKPALKPVATSGSYNDLIDKPHIPVDPVQADYEQSDSTALDYIKHKPVISKVGHTGEYDDLLGKPHIPVDPVQADYDQSDSEALDYIRNKPVISKVGHTGEYNDLLNQPHIPVDPVQSDWDESDSEALSYIRNRPEISGGGSDDADYLCFTAEQANSTVRLDKVGSAPVITLEYSTDRQTWTNYTWTNSTGETITLAAAGDKVWLRGDNQNGLGATNHSNYHQFKMTGKIYASGNITSLIDKSCTRIDVPAYCYQYLFQSCTSLLTPPKLPALELATHCYGNMFNGSGITIPPELPAMNVPYEAYSGMFGTCTALTTSPELPATTVGQKAYYYMFHRCSTIRIGPSVLPAKTLSAECYRSMFDICANFVKAPYIMATDASANWCFYNMFYNCPNLHYVRIEATSLAQAGGWFSSAAATGVFECPSALSITTRGANTVPAGWTVVRTDQPHADWNESDSTEASYIRNKPEIGGDADTVQALDGLITVLEKYAGQYSNLDYFYIKCLDANGDNITIKKPSTTTFSTFQVSLDKRKWYDVGSEISIYTSYGDKIYVRGETANWDIINNPIVTKSNGYFAIGGDMQSLISTTLDHDTSKGGLKRLTHCFYGTKIYEVENGFKFPAGVAEIETFFYSSKLATLPAGFTIPSTVSSLSYCFGSCPNLKSLPDGFTIPSSVTGVILMFLGTQINTIGNNVSINTGVNNEGNLDKSKVTSIGTGFSYMTAYTTSAASGQAVFPNATIGSGWSIYQYTDEQ